MLFITTKEEETAKYIIRIWNSFAKKNKLKQVRSINKNRYEKITNISKIYKLEDYRLLLRNIKKSSFLKKKSWFSFDWILTSGHIGDILEGRYTDNENSKVTYTGGSSVEFHRENL